MKIYVAGPFFNQQQLDTLTAVEAELEKHDNIELFRPRDSTASAKKLNKDIGAGKDPSQETRHNVFLDNVNNIDDADLVVAIIDGRDIGTIFEIGYAYGINVPIITYTNEGFGMNLMLAESTLAHCKGLDQLGKAIEGFIGGWSDEDFEVNFKRANLSETVDADKKMDLYKK
jgi:nucleoside 2-deoxyribosyltransferase